MCTGCSPYASHGACLLLPNVFLHVVQDIVLAVLCWGVPGVQFDLPQLDLLVPGAAAVLPELIGSLRVNTRLTYVSGKKTGEVKIGCFAE